MYDIYVLAKDPKATDIAKVASGLNRKQAKLKIDSIMADEKTRTPAVAYKDGVFKYTRRI